MECFDNSNVINKFQDVSKLVGAAGSDNVYTIQNLQSPFDTGDVKSLTLDYVETQLSEIYIAQKNVRMGSTIISFDGLNNGGTIILPQPEVSSLVTTVDGDCDTSWVLEGHSQLYVMANDILNGCRIKHLGGLYTTSKLTVNFGDLVVEECSGYSVLIGREVDEGKNFTTIEINGVKNVIMVGESFETIEILGSQCNDNIRLSASARTGSSISINGRMGNDTITIGSANNGLDSITKRVFVDGGLGVDKLIVEDSRSTLNKKNGQLYPGSVLNLMGNNVEDKPSELFYSKFEEVVVNLSQGVNIFNVDSTAFESSTLIYAGPMDDKIYVHDTQGDILVDGGNGDDQFFFFGIGDKAFATILGGAGNDVLNTDGSGDSSADTPAMNTFDTGALFWSGQGGNDTVNAVFTSSGTSSLTIFDDDDGINDLNIECMDFYDCTLLCRENFIANIHEPSSETSGVERINIDRYDTEAPVNINRAIIRLQGGENEMFFDDTFAQVDVIGGPGDESTLSFCVFCIVILWFHGISYTKYRFVRKNFILGSFTIQKELLWIIKM